MPLGAEGLADVEVIVAGDGADVPAFDFLGLDAAQALEGIELHDLEVLRGAVILAIGDDVADVGFAPADRPDADAPDEFVIVEQGGLELEGGGRIALGLRDFL